MIDDLTVYWLSIDASFDTRIQIFDENEIETDDFAYGFFKEFGITASSEEMAKKFLQEYIYSKDQFSPSNTNIKYEHIGVIPHNDVQKEIYEDEEIKDSLLQSPYAEGIWYTTGCGFYNDKNS